MKSKKLFFIILIICLIGNRPVFAAQSKIIIDFLNDKGFVNRGVLGNNLIGYDPMTYEDWAKEYFGYSDYGAGIWDPKSGRVIEEVVGLAKNAGVTVLRFPGGCGTHHYDWKKTIGKGREHFLYGLDEFLKTAEEIGAEPVITVSYFTGDEKDAADLIEYLNTENDGIHRWAAQRAKNGHREPYHVKYFEIGNEVWHGDHRNVQRVKPETYAERYVSYYRKMKEVDPSIKIGVVLNSPQWNKRIMGIIKDQLDFGIIHTYPVPGYEKRFGRLDPKEFFRICLAVPKIENERDYQEILNFLKERAGKDISLAITEFNGGWTGDWPVPYRHCLGTALLNAELIRIFMEPANKILLANYWQFNNSFWGMIANNFDGTYKTLHNSYYNRPNYYVFEMYYKHFGDILIGVALESKTHHIQYKKVTDLSVNASKSQDGKRLYLMVINKNMDSSITATIDLKEFFPSKEASVWVLNGPSVDATNEINHDNVKIAHHKFEIESNPFEFTFEPHSLTAIVIERAQ